MIAVYIYEGEFSQGEKGYPMIYKAASDYCARTKNTEKVKEFHIETSEHGKPYFREGAPYFSISHSGKMWMCAVADQVCGIDLEVEREVDHEKIAKRIFPEEDLHYVALWGQYGFFNLWTRREALAKWTGKGLFDSLPALTKDGDLLPEIKLDEKLVKMRSIEISDNIHCSLCIESDDPIEVILL